MHLNIKTGAIFMFVINFLLSFHIVINNCVPKDDLVINLPNFKKEDLPCMYSGYITLNEQTNTKMFYWLFMNDQETPAKTKPLVIWLGGGASSLFSLFTEIGPLRINNKGEFYVDKQTSWITKVNILYIDQPIGTGYSLTNDPDSIPKNLTTISQNFYKFIQKFFILHNTLVDKKLYLLGDSFAGKFIPSMAKLILDENKKIDLGDSHNQKINLKKISIASGIFDYRIQGVYSNDLAKGLNFISEFDDKAQIDLLNKKCENSYKKCDKVNEYLLSISGDVDIYDVRKSKEFESVEIKYLDEYLNRLDVITALNIKNGMIKKDNYWSLYNQTVSKSLADEYNSHNSLETLENLLDNYDIPSILYAGQFDLFNNPQGIERVINSMNFKDIDKWRNSTREHWKIPLEGENKFVYAGYIKQYNNLIFISVRKAGRLVSRDRPATALNLLEHIISDDKNIKCVDSTCSFTMFKCNSMELCNGNGICGENTGGKCNCNENYFGPDCSLKTEILLSKNEAVLSPSETKLFSLIHYPTDVILEIESDDKNINVSLLDKNFSEHVYDISKHMISYRLDTLKLSLIVEKEKFDKYLIVIANIGYKRDIKVKFYVTAYSKMLFLFL